MKEYHLRVRYMNMQDKEVIVKANSNAHSLSEALSQLDEEEQSQVTNITIAMVAPTNMKQEVV